MHRGGCAQRQGEQGVQAPSPHTTSPQGDAGLKQPAGTMPIIEGRDTKWHACVSRVSPNMNLSPCPSSNTSSNSKESSNWKENTNSNWRASSNWSSRVRENSNSKEKASLRANSNSKERENSSPPPPAKSNRAP